MPWPEKYINFYLYVCKPLARWLYINMTYHSNKKELRQAYIKASLNYFYNLNKQCL